MSWAQDEWKSTLSHTALQKVDALERTVEQFKKEHLQKKFQIESLQNSFENQKKKTEEQKTQVALFQKDIQQLEEQCRTSEINREKTLHELQTKESQVSCLNGQLIKLKQTLEKEVNRCNRLSTEYEQEVNAKNKAYEELQQKDTDIQKLQARLKSNSYDDVFLHVEPESHSSNSNTPVEALISFNEPKAQGFQEPFTVSLLEFDAPAASGKTNSSNTSQNVSSYDIFDGEIEVNGVSSTSSVISNECVELKTQVIDLQFKLKACQADILHFQQDKKECNLTLEKLNKEISEKVNAFLKAENEIIKLTSINEEKILQCTELERNLKQLQQLHECERHNNQAALKVQEDKMKVQEKNLREEIVCDQNLFKEQIKELERSLFEIEKKYNQSLHDYKTLEQSQFQLLRDKETLVHQADEHRQDILRLKSDQEHLVSELKRDLEETYKKQILYYENRMQEKTCEIASSTEDLNKQKTELAQLTKNINDLNEQNLRLEEAKLQGEKRITQLNLALEEINQSSQSKLQELKNDFTAKIKEKEECIRTLSNLVEEHLKNLDVVTKQLNVKKQNLEDVMFKFHSLEVSSNKLLIEKKELEKEYSIMKHDSQKKEEELLDAVEKANVAEKTFKQQEILLHEMEQKLRIEAFVDQEKYNALVKESDQKERQISKLSDEIIKMQETIALQDKQIKDVSKTIETVSVERDQYKRDYVDVQTALNESKNCIENLENNIREIYENKDQYQSEIRDLKNCLDSNNTTIKILTEKEIELKTMLDKELKCNQSLTDEHNKKICNLTNMYDQVSESLKEKLSLLSERDMKISKLNIDYENLLSSVSLEKEVNQQLEVKCLNLTTKVDQSHQALHHKSLEIQNMEKEFQEQFSTLKLELQAKAEETENLMDQIKQLENSIESLQQVKVRQEANMQMLIEDFDCLLNEKNELSVENQNYQSQLQDLTVKNEELALQNSDFLSLLNSKETELVTVKDNQVKIEQEFQLCERELRNSINDLTIRTEELETDVHALTNEKEQAKKDYDNSQKEYNLISGELSTLSIEFESLKNDRDTLLVTLETKSEKLADVEGSLQSQISTVEQLETQIESLQDDLLLKTKTYEDLLTERNHVQNQLALTQEDLEEITTTLLRKEEEYSNLKIQSESRILELSERLNKRTDKVNALQKQIKSLEEKFEKLNDLLAQKENELIDAKDKITDLEEQFFEITDLNKKLTKTNSDFESQLKIAFANAENQGRVITEKTDVLTCLKSELLSLQESTNLELLKKTQRLDEMCLSFSEESKLKQNAEHQLVVVLKEKEEIAAGMQDVTAQLEQRKEELISYKNMIVDQNIAIKDITQNKVQLEKLYEESERAIIKHKDALLILEEMKSNLLKDVNKKENDIVSLQDDLAGVREQLSKEISQVKSCNKIIEEITSENTVKKDLIEELSQKLHKYEVEISSTLEINKELEKLVAEQKDLYKKDEESQQKISTLEVELIETNNSLHAMQKYNEDLLCKLEALKEKMQENITTCSLKEQECCRKVENLQQEIKENHSKYNELSASYDHIKNQLEMTQEDMDALNEVLAEKETEHSSQLTENVEQLRALTNALMKKDEELSVTGHKTKSLESSLSSANEFIARKENEIKCTLESNCCLEKQLQNSVEKISKCSEENINLEVQLKELLSSFDDMEVVVVEKDKIIAMLEDSMREKEQQITAMSDRTNELKTLVDAKHEECKIMKENLAKLNDVLEEKSKQLFKSLESAKEKEVKLQEIFERQLQTETILQEAQQSITDAKEKHLEIESVKSSLLLELESRKSDVESLDTLSKFLKERLDRKEEECYSVKLTLSNSETEGEHLKHQVEELKERVATSSREHENSIAILTEERNFARDQLLVIEKKQTGTEEINDQLKNEKAFLETQVQTLEEEVNKITKNESTLRKEILALQDDNNENIRLKEEEMESLKIETQSATEELDKQLLKVTEMENLLKQQEECYQSQLSVLENQQELYETEVNNLKLELDDTKAKLLEKETTLVDMSKQVEETDTIMMNLKLELEALTTRNEEEVNQLKKDFTLLNGTLNKKQGRVEGLQESNSALQKKIVFFASQIDNLQAKLREEKQTCLRESGSLRNELVAVKSALSQKESEIKDQLTEQDETKKSYEILISTLRSEKASLADEVKLCKHNYEDKITEMKESAKRLAEEKVKELAKLSKNMSSSQLSYDALVEEFKKDKQLHKEIVDQLRNEISAKGKVADELKTSLKATELELQKLRDNFVSLKNDEQEHELNFLNLKKQLEIETDRLKNIVQEKQDIICKCQKDFQMISDELTEAKSIKLTLESKNAELSFYIVQSSSKISKLSEEVTKIERLYTLSNDGIQEIDVSFEERRKEYKDSTYSHAQEKQEELASLQLDLKETSREVNETNITYKNYNGEAIELKASSGDKINQLESSVTDYKTRISRLTTTNDELAISIFRLESNISELTNVIQNKEIKISKDLLDKEDEISLLQKANYNLNVELTDLKELYSKKSEEFFDLNKLLKVKESEVIKLKDQKEENDKIHNKERENLESKLTAAQNQAIEIGEELSEYKTSLSSVKDGILKLSKDREELNDKNNELYNQLQIEVSKRKDNQVKNDNVIELLKLNLRTKEQETASLSEDIKVINEKLSATNKCKDELIQQNANMTNDLYSARTSLKSAEFKIDNLETRLTDTHAKLECTVATLNALRDDVSSKDNDELQRKIDLDNYTEQICSLETQLKEKNESLSYVKKVKDELVEQLSSAKARLQKEEDAKNNLQDKNDELWKEKLTLNEELENLKESMTYVSSVKDELSQQLLAKSDEYHEFIRKQEEERKSTAERISMLEKNNSLNEKLIGEKENFEKEASRLKNCFDTLNEEKAEMLKNANSKINKISELEKIIEDRLQITRKMEVELRNENEKNASLHAEITNLNISVEEHRCQLEKEQKKFKKLQRDLEKKEISISELEKELQLQTDIVKAKEISLAEISSELNKAHAMLELHKELTSSKETKLKQIKESLQRFKQSTRDDNFESLDESIDFNTEILQLQEQYTKLEKDQRKLIEKAVEQEKIRIVDASKQFVIEREMDNEMKTKNLLDDLQLKEKKIESLEQTVIRQAEKCKQLEFSVEKERENYEKLLKISEEENKCSTSPSTVHKVCAGDEVRELQERLDIAKAQNVALRLDFVKMADDYERTQKKEKSDLKKLRTEHEKFKIIFEKQEKEMKKLKFSSLDPLKNETLVASLRDQLMKSDEKFVQYQLKNQDLEKLLQGIKDAHGNELTSLNKKLTSLLHDNEHLNKKLEELLKTISMLETENTKLKKELASRSFVGCKNIVSPLTRGIFSLKVLSSEDDEGKTESHDSACALSSTKQTSVLQKTVETPKRNIECSENFPTKRTRLNGGSNTSINVISKKSPFNTTTGNRRRSLRLANQKPYQREIPSSSSDEEVLLKQFKDTTGSNPTKENNLDACLRKTQSIDNITPLSPNKSTANQSMSTIIMKDGFKDPNQNTGPRATRSTKGGSREDNASKIINPRKVLSQRPFNGDEEEKCNMQ